MSVQYRKGAAGALLDEYEKAITALKECIRDIREEDWTKIVDPVTADNNCRSLQSIMTHVVSSAYSYATYIGQWKGLPVERPERKYHSNATAYSNDIEAAFRFTEKVFEEIRDEDMEQFDTSRKILTGWGQVYDVEQMMEHAIVHILRHRRQIEKLKKLC